MPVRDDEKLMRFVNEALGEAEEIAARIDSEVTAEEKKRLDEGEKKILTEAYELIQGELKNIRRENSQTLSREVMERRRELLLYREEIMKKVIDRAREKLTAFAGSDEYKNWLVRLCVSVLRKQSASFTIFLSPNDLRYKYAILEALDDLLDEKLETGSTDAAPVYSVTPDKNIKLGGARFYSAAHGISIDATLDDGLNSERAHFNSLLGPAVSDDAGLPGKSRGGQA